MHLPPVLAGAWRLAEWGMSAAQRLAWVSERLDAGLTAFHHASLPGAALDAQALFGQVLAQAPALRHAMQLVCQCRPAPGQALDDLVHRSLRALHTDHLDLLVLDTSAAAADTAACWDSARRLQAAGRLRYLGNVEGTGPTPGAVAHQLGFSLLQPEPLQDGRLDQCLALGVQPLAWSPLAGGRLFTGTNAHAVRARAVLHALAADTGHSEVCLAAAWVMQQPGRPRPIVGSRRLWVAQQAGLAHTCVLAPAHRALLHSARAGAAP